MMKYLKKLLKAMVFTIVLFLVFSLIVTVLNYFDIINYSTTAILKLIVPLLAIFFGGFIMGRGTFKNGWLEGLKFGFIISIISIIMAIIFKDYETKVLIFELILIGVSVFGSMIGINSVKEKKYN